MPGVGAEQAALADGDDLLAAAGEGAHDRGAAADVGAVADDDARRDAALDHGGAEGAGVEVDEALVHHRRAGGEVRAEADPVGVGDPDAGGHDVVGHPGELVDAVDGQVEALGRGREPRRLEPVDRRTGRALVHTTLASRPNMPVQVLAVRLDQAVREQVQAQVGVVRVSGASDSR